MSLVVMGASHKTSSISMREQLAVAPGELAGVLEGLVGNECVREALVLSTCNRVEVYVDAKTDRLGAQVCAEFFAARAGEGYNAEDYYLHRGPQAVSHIFRVVCSLDSQVLGEAQILGQVKRAFADAVEHGTCAEVLTKLFKSAIELGKQARTETGIGSDSVSLSTTAFKAARERIPDLATARVVLVGAGEMARLTARYLADAHVAAVTVVSRTYEHARLLAGDFGFDATPAGKLYDVIAASDLVFTMTSSEEPVVRAAELDAALRSRGATAGELVVIDEAVPRDVEHACAEIEGVALYDQETLASIADEGLATRMRSVAAVERLVAQAEEEFLAWLQERLVVPTIKEIYEKGDIVVGDELLRARRELEKVLGRQLEETELEVMAAYGNAVMKKMLHGPVMRLRKEASSPDSYYYTGAARYLFGLDVFPPGARRPCKHAGCDKGEPCPIGLNEALRPICRAGMEGQ